MVILLPELRRALLRAHSQSMPTEASDIQHAGSKEHRSVLVDFVRATSAHRLSVEGGSY